MTCEHVREQLAEHLLGGLSADDDAEVRMHLRGCASCRAEMAALAEGVSTFATAAHDVEPPPELRDRVLGALQEEWAEAPVILTTRSRSRWVPRVAAAAAILTALAWGGFATVRASHLSERAEKYDTLLGVLGGEDVRVGELRAAGSQELQGSVVIYDSKVGQSWVLVLVRAPGLDGTANVTLLGGEQTIDLHEMDFGTGGEASTWLVTSSDLTRFERVNVWDDEGLIASADVVRT